ncbi:DUF1642 domain-containing protein [Aneurinibacillus migulanus]|uniref:DUF1642 domain-containing protein n=1 Tax=Aneurinibacillus migulanus TaxID=47500 RepID=UPI00209EF020|nr:DUF1642 domain-containing protein [Aneurinibacillus migulanus]MCP1355043.1 DUF1642 domain-containing protein [Aneurinibacillus migulanus]
MDKVVLPKKVADEIKKCRSGYNDIELMEMAISTCKLSGYEHMQAFAQEDFETFLKAIANDYEVEMTPEEKALDYYEGLGRLMNEAAAKNNRSETMALANKQVGARNILIMLGIKIEGINA